MMHIRVVRLNVAEQYSSRFGYIGIAVVDAPMQSSKDENVQSTE